MIDGLKYCSKCIMPETVEGQSFDKDGLCITCQTQAQKKKVNWKARKKALKKIFDNAKAQAKKDGNEYDCIVPISGGKDSLWQIHVLVKEFGMHPLPVTYNHYGFTRTGIENLRLAQKVSGAKSPIVYKDDLELVKRLLKHSIELMGDPCWHCHSGIPALVLRTAIEKKIPLIVWGESTAEYGKATYNKPDKFDRTYFLRVSGKLTPEEFACDYIPIEDLKSFILPSEEECKGLNGIHLGDYIPWDNEKQVEFIKKEYGWKGREIGGAYKDYKSIECFMTYPRYFMCYQKRAFALSSVQASDDIRAGKFSREDGFELARKYEQIEPKYLHEFLASINMTPVEYSNAIAKHKHPAVKDIKLPAEKEWRKCEEDGEFFLEL